MERTNLTEEAEDTVLDAETSGRIRDFCKTQKPRLSIEDLATDVGMSKRTLDRRLSEGRWVLSELRAIARRLGVKLEDLTVD